MTFMELEKIFLDSGRKSDGRALIAYLLDSFDAGVTDIDAESIEEKTGLKKSNISAVAKKLSEANVINILYLDTSVEDSTLTAIRNGRWSKPFYNLTPQILSLYRRH
ncbi:hypothetical protein LLR08_24005 [Rouxiella badensis]|uniref:hypothetical protein n=1 Tax=Rouxiella badensis TaxID=1646377 RepID=UPI001D15C4B8|nr:hypothetical protein [Rouxiella badensis]MCC3705603.1 hypothetical protein [Rouxiella badensis]MCC3742532.1 hypothetical protein [Rouxiella badensis]